MLKEKNFGRREPPTILETKKVEVKLRLTIVSDGICRFHIICMYYVLNDSHKEKTSISKGLFVTPLYLLSAKTFFILARHRRCLKNITLYTNIPPAGRRR